MKKSIAFIVLLISASLFSQEIKFGKVSKDALMQVKHPIDSTANASYLYKKRNTYFNYDKGEGFVVITECHERIKIYSKEGFSKATKKISFYSPESGNKEKVIIEMAYTFNIQDNKPKKVKVTSEYIFKEKLNKYYSETKITFPQIKEGSILELKYKIISPFWSIRTLNFQYNIPVDILDYQVKIPEYFIFNNRSKGYFSVPIKETSYRNSINFETKYRSNGYTNTTSYQNNQVSYTGNKYTFNAKNIPAMKDNEPYAGNIQNYRGGMEFELSRTRFPNTPYKNMATSWEEVSKEIFESNSFDEQLRKSSYYKDDIKTILNATKTSNEKITAIFNFVKSKITWNGYYNKYTEKGVKKAYKEGVGNTAEINLMLTSMLRYAGLKANPVLVSTKSNGIPIFPTRQGFNYVIAKVNFMDGKSVLLDATDKFSVPNILPLHCLNWQGREIRKNGVSNTVPLIPDNQTQELNQLNFVIDSDLSIIGNYRKTYDRHNALIFRSNNENKKEDEIINELENNYNIEVISFKDKNRSDLSKKPTRSFKFTSEDFIEEIGNKIYFNPMIFLTKRKNPFKTEERNYPIDFLIPWQEKFSATIKIPENYSIESAPSSIAIGLPENIGVFKYRILYEKDKIRAECLLQMNQHAIPPTYYKTTKSFYKQIIEKEMEKIVHIKN